MRRLPIVLAALAFATAAAAQQYKWVDDKGRTQYGDVPPPGAKATRLRPPPPGAAPAAAPGAAKGPMSAAEKEADFRKRQLEAQKEREKQELAAKDAEQNRETCERAQEYVRTIESGQRISRTDSKGERYFLDDAQRAEELAKARAVAGQACK
ncbi:MAG: DUF4124 domain-containing protein [Betaproteobacteria bacterium]